ncbi:MAG: hypothetical protein JWL72_3866, partial [Ilumatobacteraceae bacterium]|nr:hypothetical protein [Ilumatobacteraceae bacterium]
ASVEAGADVGSVGGTESVDSVVAAGAETATAVVSDAVPTVRSVAGAEVSIVDVATVLGAEDVGLVGVVEAEEEHPAVRIIPVRAAVQRDRPRRPRFVARGAIERVRCAVVLSSMHAHRSIGQHFRRVHGDFQWGRFEGTVREGSRRVATSNVQA